MKKTSEFHMSNIDDMRRSLGNANEMIEKCIRVLYSSRDPLERIYALHFLTESWGLGKDDKILEEIITALDRSLYSEVRVAAAIAISSLPNKDKVKEKLYEKFRKSKGYVSLIVREPVQPRICYPLLIMNDREFFENIKPVDFEPRYNECDDILRAGRTSNSQAAAALIRYYQALDKDRGAVALLDKYVRMLFPGFDFWIDNICFGPSKWNHFFKKIISFGRRS